MNEKILVSGCLAGLPCRYDGKAQPNEEAVKKVERGEAIICCPETMGGLPTPRIPAEIIGGDGNAVLDCRAKVVTAEGRDVTDEYIKGAEKALKIAQENGIHKAILKAKSPSCGCGIIYDGSFTGRKKAGDGVTAALLKRSGIQVESV